jgi:hypothetical protein
MKIVLIIAGCFVVLIVILILVLFAIRKANLPLGKACVVCGAQAKFGYSEHAEEDAKKIKPMCLTCLVSQLKKDYTSFTGRAVVIQPAAGPPCYVFQPVKEWQAYFKESKIGPDVNSLLSKMESQCHDCGQKANYLWVESTGLTGDNFGNSLDNGLSETLLRHNPKPISLCSRCVVKRIEKDLRYKNLSYLEVCGPKGVGNGFVIPMGY